MPAEFYLKGLTPTLIVATIAALLYCWAIWPLLLITFQDVHSKLFSGLLQFVVILVVGLSFFVSIALFVYPSLNLVLQPTIAVSKLIDSELSTGILALRISSAVLGGLAVFDQIAIVSALWNVGKFTVSPERASRWHSIRMSVSESEEINPGLMLPSQHAIYLVVVGCLWLFAILNVTGTAVALIAWAVFFIADDWAIISHYIVAAHEEVLPLHKLRLTLFNVIFIVSLPYIFITHVHLWLGIGVALLLLICFALRLSSHLLPRVGQLPISVASRLARVYEEVAGPPGYLQDDPNDD